MEVNKNMLEVKNINVSYGIHDVLISLNCKIKNGKITGILGEEGSGKSTLINSITQSINYSGEILYKNEKLSSFKPHQLSKSGIDYLPQGGSIFSQFTVEEHIEFALELNNDRIKKEHAWIQLEPYFPKLLKMKNRLGGTLSGGERIMLSLSCLLVSNCGFILLDEPTSGLSQEVCNAIKPLFAKWKEEGKTILMTEHNFDFAFDLCDEILLLRVGKISKPFNKEQFSMSNFVENHLYNFVTNKK